MGDRKVHAAQIVSREVGVSFTEVEPLAEEAAAARAAGDWGADCGWQTDPWKAAKRITEYLDSFIERSAR